MGKRHYDVACGIIFNKNKQVLIALRDVNADQGGLWEFPGGKVEVDESVEAALSRELAEEVGIEVVAAKPWVQVDHEYPMYHVTLYAWHIEKYQGQVQAGEGQELRWVELAELANLEFPDANYPIIDELVLSGDSL